MTTAGGLVSESYAKTELSHLSGARSPRDRDDHALTRLIGVIERELGPASSLRAIVDVAVQPLLSLLGYRVIARAGADGLCRIVTVAGSRTVVVAVSPWAVSPDAVRRQGLLAGIAADARWCLICNGRTLRVVDGHRPWSRQHLEFDLRLLAHDTEARALFWILVSASALAGPEPVLDRAVEQSARHGVAVCRTLSDGMLQALDILLASLGQQHPRQRRPSADPETLLDESLTVLYRVLFLLFAEARALVPMWEPIYRDRYTVDAIVTTLMSGRRCRGIWPALLAISRLAHAGCRAGSLKVTAFNGRLFSPSHAPSVERARIDDETMARAVLAVSTVARPGAGRQRILYHDLDVEQLGAVYERVLDYEAASTTRSLQLARTGDRRKASGSYYTPRAITDWLVRRTLAPLVDGRTVSDILGLRVLDAAMGSGAFLVSACRYLAGAAEAALIRDGEWQASDVTETDRIALRREVAQRCLYGADLNPMAVQLARLSLWLATLAHEKPLTFLDHHLIVGDSLVGASVSDLRRQPPGRRRSTARQRLPLFPHDAFDALVEHTLPARLKLALEPDDDVGVVREKETLLASLHRGGPHLAWKAALDLWCACWFWPTSPRPDAALYGELHSALLHGHTMLPRTAADNWLDVSARVASAHRFLHWELEFPEVFFDEHGRRRPDAGFDAIVGNPPWDMIRGDSGEDAARQSRRQDAGQLVSYARESGVYLTSSRSHANRYQLFLERSLQLTRAGGRIGLVLPSGALSDGGAGPLRRHLFERARVDMVTGLDNRRGIFPIHRGLRIALLTATAGTSTDRISCRFGITSTDALDDSGDGPPAVVLTRAFVERLSGEEDLGLPDLSSPVDVEILERITASVPRLSAAEGWAVHFGRELNATDDRDAFVPATRSESARVVFEGKQVQPFRVDVATARHQLSAEAETRLRVPRRARLAYRDVAAATNRLTLIAAIIPARAVTTHTLCVLKTPLPLEHQQVLCALLNSFVANYLVRMRVTTHVTTALISRLPVPRPALDSPAALRLAQIARALATASASIDDMPEYAELQALSAKLYGLNGAEFEHVLSTFPLIDAEVKERCIVAFARL